ncbi:hypothetical protein BJ960_000238 [Leucobacter aridicollis]|uniref:Uncharacterized protein n=1 Tax=Leucobacter aridicollis TaxID=283878 RepID=A0A852R177_9MICO|nr:hypothetical protein [Leucobacter aridicollis]NYD25435.1 hypothetical protein [Leucobacter aridicollis]
MAGDAPIALTTGGHKRGRNVISDSQTRDSRTECTHDSRPLVSADGRELAEPAVPEMLV